jgi:hypothetical protein
MLTRSAVRGILDRYDLFFGMNSGDAQPCFCRSPRITIDSLSEDILLEIFDAHRKLYELQPHYENFWNSRDGWFKLAHVCQSWRRVVHSSPSRLDMHLLFTPHRSSRVNMLKSIPPFPILVDYSLANWTEREQGLAVAAIGGKNRSRVHGISLRRGRNAHMDKLLRALSHPFPELESLLIGSSLDHDYELILPAAFLSGSAPRLRRLTLRDVAPIFLPPLLSFTTDLIELSLTLRISRNALPEASLIANLQRLSCLRRLELRLMYTHATISDLPWPPTEPRDIVPLPNLIHFAFSGQRHYLEALVFELAAPHLQHLNVDIGDTTYTFPIPYLCRFICDTNIQFDFVRLHFAPFQVKFTAETRPKSGHASASAQSFNIIFPEHTSLEEMGNRLSGPLTTVEELVVEWGMIGGTRHVQWRRFFDHLRQVKLIQVPSQVAIEVAHAFRPDGQALAVDVLPALEQVKVQMVHMPPLSDNSMNPYITIPNAFDPLIAARRRVGCPITLSLT